MKHELPDGQLSLSEKPVDACSIIGPLSGTRILLVEDNEFNQLVVTKFLEKAGMRVSLAKHGIEALQRLQQAPFDAVLMDLQMPEMDGFEVTRQIRELSGCQDLPIIAMTAADQPGDRKNCLETGMNDYIAKPIKAPALFDILLRWIKPLAPQSGSVSACTLKPESWSALAESFPGFDVGNIMFMLQGDQQQWLYMVTGFAGKFSDEASAIAAELGSGALVAAEKRLHRLKGAAGTLGAKALHQASAKLDLELLNGSFTEATLVNFVETFDNTMKTIATMPSAQSVFPAPVASGKNRADLFTELNELLDKNKIISDALLAQLKLHLTKELQGYYDLLASHILDTDYPKARCVLHALMEISDEQH